jgi:hypothetical protein
VAFYFLTSFLHLSVRTAGYSLAGLFKRSARSDYLHKVNRSLACLRWLLSGSHAEDAMQTK